MRQIKQRGKDIIQAAKQLIKSHPKMIILPLINALIQLSLVYGLAVPIIAHETQRISTGGVPVWEKTWFYIALLVYHYLRNLCNAIFRSINILTVAHIQQASKLSLKSVLKTCWQQLLPTVYWSTFSSCFNVFYKLKSAYLGNDDRGDFCGGSYFRYACALTPTVVALEKLLPSKALKRAGRLITQTWGAPPLRVALGISGPLMSYLFLVVTPMIFVIVFLPHSLIALKISAAISAVLYLIYHSVTKVLHSIIEKSIYDYATANLTPLLIAKELIKKTFLPR